MYSLYGFLTEQTRRKQRQGSSRNINTRPPTVEIASGFSFFCIFFFFIKCTKMRTSREVVFPVVFKILRCQPIRTDRQLWLSNFLATSKRPRSFKSLQLRLEFRPMSQNRTVLCYCSSLKHFIKNASLSSTPGSLTGQLETEKANRLMRFCGIWPLAFAITSCGKGNKSEPLF